ncbi:MAG: hypothetical protein AAF624_08565 [Bacteroidota bacterium]
MSHPEGTRPTSFNEAAEAAEKLLTQLEGYESALERLRAVQGELTGLQGEITTLRTSTTTLSQSAGTAAEVYRELTNSQSAVRAEIEEVRQDVERTREELGSLVESTREAMDSVLTPVQQSAASLAASLDERAKLVEAEAQKSVENLVGPAKQAGTALVAAHERASEIEGRLSQSVIEWRTALRQAQQSELRTVRWLSMATLGAVLLFGVLSLLRGPSGGVDLDEASVQVLNGVNPEETIAGPVATAVRRAEIGQIAGAFDTVVNQGTSYILLHGASRAAGEALADHLGLPHERVVPGSPTPRNGDMTVLVGKDYLEVFPAVFGN